MASEGRFGCRAVGKEGGRLGRLGMGRGWAGDGMGWDGRRMDVLVEFGAGGRWISAL